MTKQSRIATELAQVKLLVRRIQVDLNQLSKAKADRLDGVCADLQSTIESLRA